MAFRLSQINLYSKDPQSLATFLSEILDAEMLPHDEGVLINYSSFVFMILDNGNKSFPRGNMFIEFSTESESELEALLKKVEFYRYRHALDHQLPKLTKEEKGAFLIISDTDGRKWKFSCSF